MLLDVRVALISVRPAVQTRRYLDEFLWLTIQQFKAEILSSTLLTPFVFYILILFALPLIMLTALFRTFYLLAESSDTTNIWCKAKRPSSRRWLRGLFFFLSRRSFVDFCSPLASGSHLRRQIGQRRRVREGRAQVTLLAFTVKYPIQSNELRRFVYLTLSL